VSDHSSGLHWWPLLIIPVFQSHCISEIGSIWSPGEEEPILLAPLIELSSNHGSQSVVYMMKQTEFICKTWCLKNCKMDRIYEKVLMCHAIISNFNINVTLISSDKPKQHNISKSSNCKCILILIIAVMVQIFQYYYFHCG
jgi:hypothetical protein